MKVGDKIWVLLPYHIQKCDDVEPYVNATIITAKTDKIQVEYDTLYGKRDYWMAIHFVNKSMDANS